MKLPQTLVTSSSSKSFINVNLSSRGYEGRRRQSESNYHLCHSRRNVPFTFNPSHLEKVRLHLRCSEV